MTLQLAKTLMEDEPTVAADSWLRAALIADIQGIYIRVFSFDKPNMFSARDVEPVLRQTQAPGWKSLMTIRDKEERVEMWMHERSSGGGFLLVVTEPKELVIVNALGFGCPGCDETASIPEWKLAYR